MTKPARTKPACRKPGCPLHGQVHERCTAHRKRTTPPQPCGKAPVTGAFVCSQHGGDASQTRTTAAERIARAQAERDVALFGGRLDIDPSQALLDLVQWTAGEVDYWRGRVRELAADDPDALTWGVTRTKTGGDDHGTTSEAKPNVAYGMLVDASNRLASYAAAALKAGIEERRVRLAEEQGAAVADALRLILGDILDRLLALGVSSTVEQQWPTLIGEIVPARLRALAGGGDA